MHTLPAGLPHPASSFVGRDVEIAEVLGLLRAGHRLVTLSGPGGSGKSRLAIEVAARVGGDFADGVCWVSLAVLRDARLVLKTVATALGAKGQLAEHIGDRHLLLVVDNFEQVIDAAVELEQLLESCSGLCVLVTSRERLRVAGETEYAVPPLASAEAIELFCERAAMRADATIAELCRRLDYLPLALELAAARTSVLSPTQILARLGDRLDLFRAGRGVEAKQQTLRAAIEWSCALLDPAELELFTRLAVFEGGCGVDAAERVADADVDGLQSLVDKNLLRHSGERFWMLETIREYAVELFDDSPDADLVRTRHLDWCIDFLQNAVTALPRGHADLAGEMEREFGNIRAAVRYSIATGRIESALQLVRPRLFWQSVQARTAEGAEWIETVLARADGAEPTLRARVLRTAGDIRRVRGDLLGARAATEQALALLAESGDQCAIAETSYTLGRVEMWMGAYDRALELTRAGLAAARSAGDEPSAAELMSQLAELAYWLGDPRDAESRAVEVRDFAEGLGDTHTAAEARRVLAMVERDRGEIDLARAYIVESMRMFRRLSDAYCIGRALVVLGDIELCDHRLAAANAAFVEALDVERALGQHARVADPIWGLAAVALGRGEPERAARLLGAEERLREEESAAPFQVTTPERREELARALADRVDAATLSRWWRAGRALSREEAVALAVAGSDTAAPEREPEQIAVQVLRREGEYWTVTFDGSEFRLKDSKGLGYLAALVGAPGREIHVLDLVTQDAGRGEHPGLPRQVGPDELRDARHSDAGPMLDERAKASYRNRLRELQDELDEATSWADQGRVARIKEEMDFLAHELASAMGLGGRDRRAASAAERARVNVTRAVRSAVDRIREHDRRLAAHLDATVRTGTYCTYVPDPRSAIVWESVPSSRASTGSEAAGSSRS